MDAKDILKQLNEEINNIDNTSVKSHSGIVESVGDGIATVRGIKEVMQGELLQIINSDNEVISGIALNLEEDKVGVILLGRVVDVRVGDEVKTTGKIISVPIGKELIGRVVNPLGEPIDGKGLIKTDETSPIEKIAPGVITREAVNTPIQTGIKAIDAMFPIGRGQRELIIGDRGTGKTAIAIDTIINQGQISNNPVICIYCAIGQKTSKVAQIIAQLEERKAMEYTIVVAANASDPVSLQYIAPYAACTMGEYFRDNGMDALIIYDDLTKHAWAYRQISLLLRRPAGREAYPGDIFYLHSRLLERAAKLNKELGGGSLTALPIIETQAGDISAYIPTNVISITDGQIFLESDLFYSGQRPAINIGISVSRVGGAAQVKAMKQVAGRLKLDMAQFRDLSAFAQFGSDLDSRTKELIERGLRINEVMKQAQYSPMTVEDQVFLIWAVTNGYFDQYKKEEVVDISNKFLEFINLTHTHIVEELRTKQALDDELIESLKTILEEFNKQNG